MTMPTQYDRPHSLSEALALAAQPGALALAGGALAFGQMSVPYEHIVDLQGVPELKVVESSDVGLRIGSAVMLSALLAREELPAALKTSLTRAISPNILNGASVGESLLLRAHPLLREWFACLIALGAAAETIDPARGPNHRERHLLLTATSRLEHEVITTLVLPPFGPRVGLGTAQVSRTPADASIVNAAACVHFDEAGKVSSAMAALGGVSDAPVEGHALGSLSGWPLNHETAEAAAEEIAEHLMPVGDYLGSAEYRRAMAAICLARALEACVPATEA
ncbi:MAG: FAD binding domain-containing protein [Anaerolineae bacterium]